MKTAAITWKDTTILDLEDLNKKAALKIKTDNTTPKPNIKFVDNGYYLFFLTN